MFFVVYHWYRSLADLTNVYSEKLVGIHIWILGVAGRANHVT